MVTRRQFLKIGAIASTSGMLASTGLVFMRGSTGLVRTTKAAMTMTMNGSFPQSPPITKFAQPLRGVGPGGIQVAIPDGVIDWDEIKASHYSIDIIQFQDQLLPPGLPKTTLWGYNPRNALGVPAGQPITPSHLGGIIVAEKGKPVQITFTNKLVDNTGKPLKHILPVDKTIMGAEPDQIENRVTTHFHGGEVPWLSDGGPFTWFDSQGNYGSSIVDGKGKNLYKIINPKLKAGQGEYYYPMKQSARFGWYHDHAVGITRLNAYAGIASGLIIRDNFERSLVKNLGLPQFIELGGRELPLVIQEKIFLPADDSTFSGSAKTKGSLWYPSVYDPMRWMAADGTHPETIENSAIPEFFGDTMLVNGTAYPEAVIEPRRYRLRILNATQARFLNLQVYEDNGQGLPDFTKPGPDFLVIGTEGGFLAKPVNVKMGKRVKLDQTQPERSVNPADPGGSLITAPAERWDVVVNFNGKNGKKYVLYNDAPAPFPGGGPENDGPHVLATTPGEVIYTNQILMRFVVKPDSPAITPDKPLLIHEGLPLAADPLSGTNRPLTVSWFKQTPLAGVKKVRHLTLNEIFDDNGRLIQMLGTNQLVPMPMGFSAEAGTAGAPEKTYARGYMDAATEDPEVGTVEIWQIANLTGDTHPMHFHLVNVQLLSRQPFSDYKDGKPVFGPNDKSRGPDPLEIGWKDTIKMNPGEVTTIIMKFDLAPVPFNVPESPRKDMDGNTVGGNEFVWHCHILEHEEHDMMRPLVVRGKNPRLS